MWLKLQWTRFFTLAKWDWKLSTHPGFDFVVTFPCDHSECSGSHSLRVRVVEKGIEALRKSHSNKFSGDEMYSHPNPALFGNGPKNTCWQMSHGAGGGQFTLDEWDAEAMRIWQRAAHS